MPFRRAASIFAWVVALATTAVILARNADLPPIPAVTLVRTPQGGIQPQTALDVHGVLHMIYFKGDASAGDIEYVRREPGANEFSEPMRVNSDPMDALAVGTVRGPQMAVGRGGRVYVVWFAADRAKIRGPKGATPVLFSRLNDAGTAFEPERNLMQYAQGVDGGLSVAADNQGDVYVVWHARGEMAGDANRRVYLAPSTDDGKTFTRETPISPARLGACGCCGMRAFVDSTGTLYVLYRAAGEGIHRDMSLLVSRDRGRTFRDARVAAWQLNACPMTTDYLSEGGGQVLAAWETAGEVYFDEIQPGSLDLSRAVAAPGEPTDRKHPAVARNVHGQVLLAWTEGTGWNKSGTLAWQLFDAQGKVAGVEGHAPGVPIWGLPSVFTDRRGNFTIVY
ncbi:MAG: hypothetical protein DMG21_12710 [Acidobacteria bacterium]|nr:MAG: hypothetical protein DMG21_12710 [Acidobacteriota bacterium]